MFKKIITLQIFLLLTTFLHSQNLLKIDSLSHHLIDHYKLKGIAIVGVSNNKIIYNKTFGMANETSALSDSSRIYIASNTKAFVGLALSKLAFEKQINYSDLITKYISSSKFPDNIEADQIKIKDLLQHTHGLSNDAIVFRTAYSGDYPSDLSELLKYTVYQNDTLSHNFRYSNLGYLIGGIIIKNVTGLEWKDYLKKNIFNPIGMSNTTTKMDFNTTLEVLPFDSGIDEHLSSRKTENTLHSAGGIYSTLDDMGKWLRVFTNESQTIFNKNLVKSYLNERTIVQSRIGPFSMDEYGNGWIYGSLMGDTLFFHFGSFYGYESMMSFNPNNKSGVFVFINERIAGQRLAAMLSAYFYFVLNGDTKADEKISMFSKFIDPMYAKKKETKKVFTYENSEKLIGTYFNPKYGNLIVDKNTEGFRFSLGRLKAIGKKGEKENEIIIEWTPGIEEHFLISIEKGNIKLNYGDFGVFIKQ